MATDKSNINNNKEASTKKFQKSYFDVLGLCCTSEVPLIEKILKPLDGVKQVSVIVPSKTVIVIHDTHLISQIQIVRALNQARLDASVRVYGEKKKEKKWPSLYTIGCGLLLLGSFFRQFFHPLKWLAVAAVVVGLPPILIRCYAAVKILTLDINILVLIAVGGTMAMQDYWEAASIVFLFTIAEWLESRASRKATTVMSTLMSMAPQKAILAENGLIVDAKDVQINTIIAVKAGEVIPIDGIVVDGSCEVDEKSLTGEPYPVTKQNQSKVLAGTISLNGYISVKTTVLADDCAVAKMAKLVEEAQNNKSQTQRFIDKCALYYTPAVVIISIGLAAVPAALKVHDLRHWFHLALVVLVSACPCALILSTPVATFCALTKAATNGLLIKGGDYLEVLAKIKIIAFDKTGTLTKGEFSVTDFLSISHEVSHNDLLYWVSSIESKSSHPMAAALIDYGRFNSIEPRPENVSEYQNFPGEGICGEIDGKRLYVGNKKMASRAGCEIVSDHSTKGTTVGYVFLGATQVGIFSLSDTCRLGVAEAINKLKTLKIKSVMLTGDSQTAAMRCQNQLGNAIDVIHAELLPEEKAKIIKELKEEGPTAMIGDGVNDAPALATADIGISMGISGSALATETGNITLMSNDIGKIPKAVQLARKTKRKIVENVILSIVTKTAILALAVAGYPLLWAAVLADVGTCLLVIFNSMLLLHGTTNYHLPHFPTNCGHLTHKGHCHDKASSCGFQDVHTNLSTHSHSNTVEENCCSSHVAHSPRTNTCQDKFDHEECGSGHGNHQHQHDHHEHESHNHHHDHEHHHHEHESHNHHHDHEHHHHDHENHHHDNEHHHHHHEHEDHHQSLSSCEKKDSCKASETKHHCHIGTTHGMDSSSHVIHIEKDAIMQAKNSEKHAHDTDKHIEGTESSSLTGSKLEELSKSNKKSAKEDIVEVHDHSQKDNNGHCRSKCKNHGEEVGMNSYDSRASQTSRDDTSSMVMQLCNSLEHRDMGGCCKRYRKECGGNHHGCLGGGGGIGSLSEIITE